MNKFIKTGLQIGCSFFLASKLIASPATDSFTDIKTQIQHQETKLSATIGVSILDAATTQEWGYQADKRVPLTSTFKTLACAKLLQDIEQKKVLASQSVLVRQADLITYSPVLENYVGKPITPKKACEAAMLTSDNTAANIVLSAIGGPAALTEYLHQDLDDKVTRLDRFEPDLNQVKLGDLRDTTTPQAMTQTLYKLLFTPSLSAQNQAQLKDWLLANQVTGNLLRAVLPKGYSIGDRSGAGDFGARGITAVIWEPIEENKNAPIIVSIYITQTEASMEDRDQAIKEIGKAIFKAFSLSPKSTQ